jgi:hypothetical protein
LTNLARLRALLTLGDGLIARLTSPRIEFKEEEIKRYGRGSNDLRKVLILVSILSPKLSGLTQLRVFLSLRQGA